MATTTYDINVRYKLQDKTSKGAERMGTALKKTDKAGRGLLRTIKMVAAGAVVGFGMRAGKKWLIDYNSQLEDAKLKMTGLISLNMGGEWAANQKKANNLISQFRTDAISSAGTMQDFAEFSGMITGPILRAGMSMKDLREITKGGVVAAKAFGIEAGMAALDIEQALAGTLTKKDRFARALLEPMGITTEMWNEMATETPELIGKNLVKAFNQPALKQMADAYKTSWSGVTSTLKDNLQQTLGKVGLPLMKALVKEVKSINEYFMKNPEKVEQFVKRVSEGLVTGFSAMKSAIGFIVEHAGTLMAIAKAYVGFKLVSGVGGMLGGMGRRAAGAGAARAAMESGSVMLGFQDKVRLAGGGIGGLTKVTKHATGGLKGLAGAAVGLVGKFNLAMMGLGAVYVAASAIANKIDRDQERALKRISSRPQGFLGAAAGDRPGGEGSTDAAVLAQAKSAGLVSGGEIDRARFLNAMAGKKGSAKDLEGQMASMQIWGKKGRGADFREMLGAQERYGADKRSVEAFDRLEAILEKESAAQTARLKEMVDSHKGYLLLHGGLMNYMRSGAMAEDINRAQMFDVSADDQRFVGPTGEGEYRPGADKPTKKNGDVKVYINTIKVAADDPDRFAMRMIGAFRNANTKPVASRIRVPGGRPA